jgi:hypothetical protein
MHVRAVRRAVPAILCASALAVALQASGQDKKAAKPSVSVKVSPIVGFSPARMVLTADLKGDDSEDLYCASVEWDWGDDTRSESKTDCDPYEAGKSEIKRHFTIDHVQRGRRLPRRVSTEAEEQGGRPRVYGRQSTSGCARSRH